MSSETSLGPSKRAVEKSAKAIKLPNILYSPFRPLVVDKFDGELNRFNAPLNTPIVRMLNVVVVASEEKWSRTQETLDAAVGLKP